MKEALLVTVPITNIVIGFLVLFKNQKSIINRTFFIMVFGAGLWGLGFSIMVVTNNFLWSRMVEYGFLIFIFGANLFAYVFPEKNKVPKKFILLFFPLFILAVLIPFGLVIEDAIFYSDGSVEPVNGSLFYVFMAVLVFYTLSIFWLFLHKYKNFEGPLRAQMNYLFLGLGIFLVTALIFDVILPAFGISHFNFLGPITLVFFVGITAYAIVRYRLMNIRTVIQRGVIYSVIVVTAGFFYVALILFFIQTFGATQNSAFFISSMFLVFFGIFGSHKVEKHFRKITDKIFFKDKYDYSDALCVLSEKLSESLTISEIEKNMAELLKEIFKTECVIVSLFNEKIISNSHKDYLVQEVVNKGAVAGHILVGPKKSGDIFESRDSDLLKTLSLQIAISLEKALLYQKLENQNQTLERRVAERTKEILVLQERQQQMIVEISHNLQTPLTILKTQTEESSSKKNSSELQKLIDDISHFIYKLLYFAKLDFEENKTEFKKIDLSFLIREEIEHFALAIKAKKVKIGTDLQKNVFILGDKQQIKELFLNLLSNSIKYLRKSEGDKIFIKLNKKTKNKATFSIKDNGVGILKKDFKKIFKRFYRVSGAESKARGIGLGLAICKNITERHGGKIWVESKKGVGSEFFVELPIVEE